ncbi:hypothetical protein ACEPPN_013179 [Leptodophora sp. 'Broadleaf-Isolate-01']
MVLKCVVVYRDYDNIILQENNGLTERRPKRYTINLTEEAGPRDDQLLEDSLDVRNTWEVVGEVDGKSYWRRRQDLSESRAYQKIVEDDIHDRIRLEQEVPCALLSYSPGLRLWLDETTGEELQQQDVTKKTASIKMTMPGGHAVYTSFDVVVLKSIVFFRLLNVEPANIRVATKD